MHRTQVSAAVFAALVTLAAAAPAFAAYGAFAFDEKTGKYGVSWNEDNQGKADQAALKGCQSEQCKVVFRTGPHECGAIATAEQGAAWGGAKRPKREGAELAAIQNCQKRTKGQCKIRANECNR
jgi:hypothetical protein